MAKKLGYDRTVSNDADVYDTLALINRHVNTDSKSQFVKDVVAKLGPVEPAEDFMHRVFDYYCRNVEYKLDQKGVEKVYTPARTIHEGKGDCKKAATFLASVCVAAGITPVLKHVYYDNNTDFTHIYVIVPTGTNSYITLDPTNNCQWNKEVSYSGGGLYYLDGKSMILKSMGKSNSTQPNSDWATNLMTNLPFSDDMAETSDEMEDAMNGVTNNLLGGPEYIGFSFKHKFHFPSLANIVKDAEKVVKGVEHSLATVSMVIPRGVFLGGVKVNTAGLAGNLLKMYAQDPNKVDNFWKDFGGIPATLHAAVVEGAKKKPLLGPEYINGTMCGPEVILAAAAPIVAGAAAILATLKPGSPASKDLNALAGATMTAASGGDFDAIASAAASGYAADSTGAHTMPAGSQFAPPGHVPEHYGGSASGVSVGFTAMIVMMTMFSHNLALHNYFSCFLLFVGIYTNIFLYHYSPFYFNHKTLWQKLSRLI